MTTYNWMKLYLLLTGLILSLSAFGIRGFVMDQDPYAVYQADELKNGTFLHDFLVVGPFPNPLPEGVTEYFHTDEACPGFSKDYLEPAGGESGVRPGAGDPVELPDGEIIRWQVHHSEYDKVDLRKIFTPNEGVVAYAALWIESKKKQEKLFGIGSNDGVKVWFNGEPILRVHKPRPVKADDEYLRLKLNEGRNLLLIKIGQGFGGWGFILRPVDEQTAWDKIQENLDVALNSEFYTEEGYIKGTVGDRNVVGMLRGLPEAEVVFRSIHSDHQHTIHLPLGSALKLPLSDFPGDEYSVSITFPTENDTHTSFAYLCTGGDVIEETRKFIYKELPEMPASAMADHFQGYMETTRWLDQTNKLWQHPYGYRRYLDGLKFVHAAASELSKPGHPFLAVFPPPAEKVLTGQMCRITSAWSIYDPGKADDFIISELERVWQSTFGSSPEYSDNPEKDKTIRLEITDKASPGQPEGSYALQIEQEQLVITSSSRQGLFYGINTLLQALEQQRELPVGTIRDQPAYPLRSTLQTATELTPGFIQNIEQLARLRYNVVYIYSGNYFDLDDPQKLKNTEAMFEFCRSRFIEPVPYFETFGSSTITRLMDPCLDEGIYHEKESWQVPENGIIELAVPRILDCPGTSIQICTKDGRVLTRDSDYKIISTEKPLVEILKKELRNRELLLSYDAVDFSLFPHPASCPSDPQGWEIQEKVISNVLTKLQPGKLHISQDEAGAINSCSRCLARNLSNKEIMIDQINRVYGIIRKYDPDVDICIWGDLFNDFQNAPVIGAEGAVEGLPKDILVHDWNYVAVYHSDKKQTLKQMSFYLDRGFRVGGVVWFEPANIIDILQAGEKRGSLFRGIMHTAWSDFDHSLYPVAEANWTGTTLQGRLKF
ncbi:MAG: glycoside hydrolase family 20 zincin-like fold domain-containing protein [Bacteroidota bacterium]